MTLEDVFVSLVCSVVVEGWLCLFAEDIEDGGEREVPSWGQEGGRARVGVELVREREEGRNRVELVLAFEDEGGFVRRVYRVALTIVGGGQAAGWRWLERVTVGGLDDEFGLGVDGT